MKVCFHCKNEKEFVQFHKHKDRTDGYYSICKECRKTEWQKNYSKNGEKIRARAKNFYKENKEHIIQRTRNYYENNKEDVLKKALIRQKEKMQTDPKYRLSRRLRNRLYYALKRKSWKKNTRFSEYIGCSLEELKIHLQNQFVEGMSWENMGLWHVDHRIPLISAQNDEEMYKLCHYSNLAPMWAKENIKKGSKS